MYCLHYMFLGLVITLPCIKWKSVVIDFETVPCFQGIYRLSTTKSKVEKLCQSFETEPANVDLTDANAHVVASVLKLYLRQVGN